MSWRSPGEAFRSLKDTVSANYLQASLKNQYNQLQNPIYSVAGRTMPKLDKSPSFEGQHNNLQLSRRHLPRQYSSQSGNSNSGRSRKKKFTILTRPRCSGKAKKTNKVAYQVPTAVGKATMRNSTTKTEPSHHNPQLPAVFQTYDRGVSPTPATSVPAFAELVSESLEPSLLALKVQYFSEKHAKWFDTLADYKEEDLVSDLCEALNDLVAPADSSVPAFDADCPLHGVTLSSADC